MWGTIIDVVFIGIIVICAIIGIAKGLIDSVLGLISTGLAVVGAIFLSKYVGNWVNKIFNLEEAILGQLEGGANGAIEFFGGKFSLSNIEVAKFCIWIITVLALFLIIKLIIFVLAKIFEKVTSTSPTITGINRVLGMVFGLVKGAIIGIAGIAIGYLFAQVPVVGAGVKSAIGETKVASWVSRYVETYMEENLTKESIQGFIQKIAFEATGSEVSTTSIVGTYNLSSVTLTIPDEDPITFTKQEYDAEMDKAVSERNQYIELFTPLMNQVCEIKEDGSFTLTYNEVNTEPVVISGTWSLSGSKLTLTGTGEEGTETYEANVTSNSLSIIQVKEDGSSAINQFTKA